MSSKIFIITGTSGVGKDSVIEGLKKSSFDFEWVKTTVSRPPREGESEGNPYYFVSPETFQKKIDQDEMIEYAKVYGNYYGAEKREIERCFESGKPVIWKVDIQGVPVIKKRYPDSVCIFLSAPNFEILEKRIRSRGKDDEKTIQKRMQKAKIEMGGAENNSLYDYIVVNEEGKLQKTIGKVSEIIRKNS
jgi:guanylate kinase